MAVTAYELGKKNTPTANSHKTVSRTPTSVRTFKFDDDSSKRSKTKKKKYSAYLNSDKVQLFSRMTEKRFIHKKNELFSSFPMAASIYRASSDELKALKKNRQKARKSVLTLPNVPVPMPKTCTVSDINDSEYFNHAKNNNKSVASKGFPDQKKKSRRTKGFELYNRNPKHLLEQCSSSDMFYGNYNGDGKVDSTGAKNAGKADLKASDVWSVLRNINKFQFRPTPRISDEDSLSSKKKKSFITKHRSPRGRRLIATSRTEEVSYVANFEIRSRTSVSRSSSFDRVTVINKNELQKKQFDESIGKIRNPQQTKYLVTLNERNAKRNLPKVNRTTNVKESRILTQTSKQNVPKLVKNGLNVNRSDSESTFKGSIDSSNCFRVATDLDEVPSVNLKMKLIHPNEFKEIIYNGGSRAIKKPIAGNDKLIKMSNNAEITSSEKSTKGMAQVVYNNRNNVSPINANRGLPKPKPRLVTTMPSAATMPKLTASDIKRRLSQIKFPIVVLGKDELSSTIEVFDYDPPQFDGLNKHIWPFMLEWKKKNATQKKCSVRPIQGMTSNMRKINEISVNRLRDKKAKDDDDFSLSKRVDSKRKSLEEISNHPDQNKLKPMSQFKDKMLRLLYKNTAPSRIEQSDVEPIKTKPEKVDAYTEIKEHELKLFKILNEPKVMTFKGPTSPKKVAFAQQKRIPKTPEAVICTLEKPNNALRAVHLKFPGSTRYSWTKAKWASEFVDNVIRKIKNGSYYGIEDKKCLENIDENCDDDDSKEVQAQACQSKEITQYNFNNKFTQKASSDDEYDPLLTVPGFDDALPNLEIKTLNASQIQVKNCLTNVLVQFDVLVPSQSSTHLLNDKRSSSSYIPLSVTDSNTKVYKCSTTILNTVLPAELCSVIPKLMQNIINSTTTIASTTATSHITISELSTCESDVPNTQWNEKSFNYIGLTNSPWLNNLNPQNNMQVINSQNNQQCIPQNYSQLRYNCNQNKSLHSQNPSTNCASSFIWPKHLPIYMPPILRELLDGRFKWMPLKAQRTVMIPKIKLKLSENVILPKPFIFVLMANIVNPRKLMKCISKVDTGISGNIPNKVDCKALQLYKEKQTSWIPSLRDVTGLLQKMWQYCKFNIHLNLPNSSNFRPICSNKDYNVNNFSIDMLLGESQGVKKRMSVTISNLHISTFYNGFNNSQDLPNGSVSKRAIVAPIKLDFPKKLHVSKMTNNYKLAKSIQEKLRKRRYINLYNKCKSTNYVSGDKMCIPVSAIASIEDFTRALGANKILCSVFDGCSGKKVLQYVGEMKSWLNAITPCQALLVLLLANKKDTPNLVRFRPVLLQGIAVNRITRASELDMEIEVIETEYVQLSQCEGNIPSSIFANRDSLFEELCWIAKTTASDYQKPFEESSEKLLKSLLGKRKALNPSYLRVMARYVGLGLLKMPARA